MLKKSKWYGRACVLSLIAALSLAFAGCSGETEETPLESSNSSGTTGNTNANTGNNSSQSDAAVTYYVGIGADSSTMSLSSVKVNNEEKLSAATTVTTSWTGYKVDELSDENWTVAFTFKMTEVGTSNWTDFNWEIRNNNDQSYWGGRYDNYMVGWLTGYYSYGAWGDNDADTLSAGAAYGGHWYNVGTNTLAYDHSETLDKTCVLTFQKLAYGIKATLTSEGTEVWSCLNPLYGYEKSLASIELDTSAVQKTFTKGTTFNSTGLKVTAKYDDESTADVSNSENVSVEADLETEGSAKVTVSYTEGDVTKTAEYEIEVTATVSLSSIEIADSVKKTFALGDAFSTEGLAVTAKYSDATEVDVTSSATVDSSAVNTGKPGAYTVSVSYTEDGVTKTATYDVVYGTELTGTEWWSGAQTLGTTELTANSAITYIFTVASDGADCVVEAYDSADSKKYLTTSSQLNAWGMTVINGGTQTLNSLKAGNIYSATVSYDGTNVYVVYKNLGTDGTGDDVLFATGSAEIVTAPITVHFDAEYGTFYVVSKTSTSDSLFSDFLTTFDSIEIAVPENVSFIKDSSFSTDGVSVTGKYGNTEIDLSYYANYSYADSSSNNVTADAMMATAGTYTVTVTCGSESESYAVEVKDVAVSSIAVTAAPTITSYTLVNVDSIPLDTTGLVVTATLSDETTKTLDNADLTIGEVTSTGSVSIAYGDVSTTLSVTVTAETYNHTAGTDTESGEFTIDTTSYTGYENAWAAASKDWTLAKDGVLAVTFKNYGSSAQWFQYVTEFYCTNGGITLRADNYGWTYAVSDANTAYTYSAGTTTWSDSITDWTAFTNAISNGDTVTVVLKHNGDSIDVTATGTGWSQYYPVTCNTDEAKASATVHFCIDHAYLVFGSGSDE